jgi:hypothetical protein
LRESFNFGEEKAADENVFEPFVSLFTFFKLLFASGLSVHVRGPTFRGAQADDNRTDVML